MKHSPESRGRPGRPSPAAHPEQPTVGQQDRLRVPSFSAGANQCSGHCAAGVNVEVTAPYTAISPTESGSYRAETGLRKPGRAGGPARNLEVGGCGGLGCREEQRPARTGGAALPCGAAAVAVAAETGGDGCE
jgi:hypothetical protein